MPPEHETAAAIVERWLAGLERALAAGDGAGLDELFQADSHWRDVVALSWDITTVVGADAIGSELITRSRRALPRGFKLDRTRTPPRRVTRAGVEAIEGMFRFETNEGRCNGVVRLIAHAENGTTPKHAPATSKAWALLTALDEIKDDAAPKCSRQPPPTSFTSAARQPKSFSRDFRGPNWLDHRTAAAAYADRDPAVLVVGAGQAGLSIAAQLTQLQVDTLVVERGARIGDSWRKRYHALTLHNQAHVNHLPFMPFPKTWPTYIPKDKLAGWFEAYAESMELNVWTATEFEGGAYDEEQRRWSVEVRRADGTRRRLNPRHIVMASGASDVPNMPVVPGLSDFQGTVVHSGAFAAGAPWRGKRVLVVGTGTSGHDIAQNLHSSGATVTMVQRNPTMVVNIEPSAQLPYTLYSEGLPLEDCDLITTSLALPVLRNIHQRLTEAGRQHDLPLLERLQLKGFRLDFGKDATGWQFKYLTRGGGYYFNVGCSDLIADGEIGLVQFSDIDVFVPEGARLKSGEPIGADLVVLATGYKGQEHTLAKLFGDDVAGRVGPIWGFGDELELRNMFKRTAQPGLWFIAGAFAQCRIYSKYLALQIAGNERGLV